MKEELLNEIVAGVEGISVEFKEGANKIPKSLYETVCSFSNRQGGNIYLGVADNGEITGVDEDSIVQMKKDFVTTIQSPGKIDPPLYLDISDYKVNDKSILHIFVPSSSQVHRLNGNKIYDRNEDADIDISNNTIQVQQLYNRKQSEYTERKIYPHVQLTDLREELIERLKKTALQEDEYQIWSSYSHLEILKSLGMYSKDYTTGVEGFTLAAIITFGKDELISAILPYFRIDALVKKEDTERYDDRENIRTNLIESYDRLMSFVKKHTSNKFYLENSEHITTKELMAMVDLKDPVGFRKNILNPLIDSNLILRTIPEKPTSPKQKYMFNKSKLEK